MKKWSAFCLAILFSACRGDSDILFVDEPINDQPVARNFAIKEILDGAAGVDIVWVIDSSGSMGDEIHNVISNAQLFMNEFTRLTPVAWRLGTLSADPSDSPFLGFQSVFDFTSPNPTPTFQQSVQHLWNAGGGYEEPFDAAHRAIEQYPNFIRPEAGLAIIMVTDEPEQSESSWGGGANLTVQQFLDYLIQLKGSLEPVRIYGILSSSSFGCSGGYFAYPGSRFEQVITATQGSAFGACDPQFGVQLATIGQDIASLASHPVLHLARRPLPSTIRVTFEGRVLPGGPASSGGVWTYDMEMNAIVFYDLSFAPDPEEQVEVEYLPDLGYE